MFVAGAVALEGLLEGFQVLLVAVVLAMEILVLFHRLLVALVPLVLVFLLAAFAELLGHFLSLVGRAAGGEGGDQYQEADGQRDFSHILLCVSSTEKIFAKLQRFFHLCKKKKILRLQRMPYRLSLSDIGS